VNEEKLISIIEAAEKNIERLKNQNGK